MALHTKWSSGDLIFYDGTQDIFRIKNSTGGIVVGTSGAGVPYQFYGNITYPNPATVVSTGSTGLVVLTADSNRIQFLKHSTGAPIVVSLPSATGNAGLEFKIFNKSTGSTGYITIESIAAGATGHVAYIPSSTGTTGGGAAIVVSDGTSWGAMVGFASTH
ncbi:hypothetical protein ES708_17781 [subsurface metagenome]